MTEEQWILFPENLNAYRDEVEGNVQTRRKKKFIVPQGTLLYSKTRQKQILKSRWNSSDNTGHLWSRATAVNIGG